MAIVKTIISVPSQSGLYALPGDFDADAVKRIYASQITGLDSMTASAAVSTGPEGDVRTITFTPRTGNKG